MLSTSKYISKYSLTTTLLNNSTFKLGQILEQRDLKWEKRIWNIGLLEIWPIAFPANPRSTNTKYEVLRFHINLSFFFPPTNVPIKHDCLIIVQHQIEREYLFSKSMSHLLQKPFCGAVAINYFQGQLCPT